MLTWSKSRVLSLVYTQSPLTVVKLTRTITNNSAKPVKIVKPRKETTKAKHFVDYRRVRVCGGNGGDGCLSFLSLPRKEYAGPDGGDGGNGGHVIFKADTNKRQLEHVSSIVTAQSGENGRTKNCHGKNADHSVVHVPLGTIIKDENRKFLANLEKVDEYFIAARGGAGGKGNHFFLTNEERAPMIAEKGGLGEQRTLGLELRTIADVGLIGFPNAGKSTLLRAISRARPKVAEYPFTTLNPYVGMVLYDDYEQIAVADIPGLITGAHQNRGLGFSFLRHIQRCVALLYVIDLSVEKCWTQLEELKKELEAFETGLSTRPHAIVANKIDTRRAKKNLADLEKHVTMPIFAVSAQYKENIDPLLDHIRELYDEQKKEKLAERLRKDEEE